MHGYRNLEYSEVLSDYRILGWGLLLLFFALTLLPAPPLTKKQIPIDKLFHGVAYFFLTLSFREGYKKKSTFFIAALLGFIGAIVEAIQALIPWRQASLGDLIANLVGISIAFAIPRRILFRLWEVTGTVLFIGKIPVGPGTLTSAFVLLLYAFSPLNSKALILVVPPLFFLAVWTSSLLEGTYGKDPKRVTIDEAVGVLVAVLFHEKTLRVLVLGFLLFRLFDIWKPWFVRRSQNMPGGLGVVADDVLAGILANLGIVLLSQVDKIVYVGLF